MHGWGVSTRVGRFGPALAVIVLLSPARAPAGQAGPGADRLALVIRQQCVRGRQRAAESEAESGGSASCEESGR